MAPAPSRQVNGETSHASDQARRLVLCFDGTSQGFHGDTSDSNVVKIHKMLERECDSQFHYYQPGIGTYKVYGGVFDEWIPIRKLWNKIRLAWDAAFATSFEHHVAAGYKFIMNNYTPDAKVYMFGFSRGAYTARELSRMIGTVGLLSKGNKELIPFAYELHRQYEKGVLRQNAKNGGDIKKDDHARALQKIRAFREAFCRREPGADLEQDQWVQCYFLGLFDCVNSVAGIENPFGRWSQSLLRPLNFVTSLFGKHPPFWKSPDPVSVIGVSQHVRHAVSIDERRVKFTAALFDQNVTKDGSNRLNALSDRGETISEVWFSGNHKDIGGGYPAPKKAESGGIWKKIRDQVIYCVLGAKAGVTPAMIEDTTIQISDIPLSWMLNELDELGKERGSRLKVKKDWGNFQTRVAEDMQRKPEKSQAMNVPVHDVLHYGHGSSLLGVWLWWFCELLPLFMLRKELHNGAWAYHWMWPHLGRSRQVPREALLHQSVRDRINYKQLKPRYKPGNKHGDWNWFNSHSESLYEDSFDMVDGSGVHSLYRVRKQQP